MDTNPKLHAYADSPPRILNATIDHFSAVTETLVGWSQIEEFAIGFGIEKLLNS